MTDLSLPKEINNAFLVHSSISCSPKGTSKFAVYFDQKEEGTDWSPEVEHLCFRLHQALLRDKEINQPDFEERKSNNIKILLSVFDDLVLSYKEIPNQYCIDTSYLDKPWLEIATKRGLFLIGKRKRVFSITWDKTNIEDSAEDIFPLEDVTKVDKCIHAWTIEKAKQYVKTLFDQPYDF